MKNLKYSKILEMNKHLNSVLSAEQYQIGILANITINQIKEILEYSLRIEEINAKIKIGNYDNIVQDSLEFQNCNLIIIFWELSNIVGGLHHCIEIYETGELEEIFNKICTEINMVLRNLEKTSLVFLNQFTSLHFSSLNIKTSKLESLSERLNYFLKSITEKTNNIKLIDIDKVISYIGVEKSTDLRFYYSSKALYTIDFFKAYSQFVKPAIMSANGKSKKILVFDCDNTLWGGILGEDGINGIEMSQDTATGAIYREVQNIALDLSKNGILIGICSKNNPEDVDKVIGSHPDMILREKDIDIKICNWNDKVTNLQNIANELNLGLESIIFVDDSPFEVNLVREKLPAIKVLQVPEKKYEYPKRIRDIANYYYNLSSTDEDKIKKLMYRQQKEREILKNDYIDIEDYLASLEIQLKIYNDNKKIISRLSQMTQKTNQFNLTTKRYTEGDIKNKIENKSTKVIAFSVSDKFGDYGITALNIINIDKNDQVAYIDSFLMSCRIVGRNIEYKIMDYLVGYICNCGTKKIKATYTKTKKNELVQEFYDKCSFKLLAAHDYNKEYELEVKNYQSKDIKYIKLEDYEYSK